MATEPLRFVCVRKENNRPIEVVGATPRGSLRVIEMTTEESLTLIKDMAGYLRKETRKGDANG